MRRPARERKARECALSNRLFGEAVVDLLARDEQARKNFDVSVEAVKELLVACKQIDNSLAEEAVA